MIPKNKLEKQKLPEMKKLTTVQQNNVLLYKQYRSRSQIKAHPVILTKIAH